MKTKTLNFAIALILGTALASSAALAAKPPNAGGGGKPPSEATQNLSVPAILVGPLGALSCGASASSPTPLVEPTGTPQTGYELDPTAYYWVQKVNAWQAQCFNATTASVYGSWGDNLTGDAKLSTGSPIRVELVLTNSGDFAGTIPGNPTPTLQGYTVVKLQPSLADRLSAYGHLAGGNATSGWTNSPMSFPQSDWVVHDGGMQIEIYNKDTSVDAVPLQTIAPEINATGKVVYGYNLRVTAAGTYTIHFKAPNVTFTGVDAGTYADNDAYLDIVVTAKAGGGGGGGGKPPK
jgi:hypothetical protein